MFGLVQSPFLLGGTLQYHLQSLKGRYPKEVDEILKSLYVDDLITGGKTTKEVCNLKNTAVAIFGEAGFELQKWHSNEQTLESEANSEQEDEKEDESYAKEQLGVKPGETKMLGLPWDKLKDTMAVTFPAAPPDVTKRETLRFLASIYDPLGIALPVSLVGKIVYQDICDQRIPWDVRVPEKLAERWNKFEKSLSSMVQVPRSLPAFRAPITAIELHVFGDTSGARTAAAVYAVVQQPSGTNQGLLAAKSRLAKKGLTIPRLELVSAHMASNLVANVKDALQDQPIRSVYGWLDTTVALHWIKGGGSIYKQFVANRVSKIREKDYITWRHGNTDQSPADVGSRGCDRAKLPNLWLKGPEWLASPESWPAEILTEPSKETEAEAKFTKEVLGTFGFWSPRHFAETKDDLDEILNKQSFWKTMRVTAWIMRFAQNCKQKKSERLAGPLTTSETDKAVHLWVKKAQESNMGTEKFKQDQLSLYL